MVTPPDLFRGRVLLSVARGSQGEIWIGTEGAGIYRNFQQQWTRYDESSGLSNVFVWSVLETRAKELLVGTWGGGLHRFRAERFETPPEFSQITSPVVALHEGHDGTVWIGTTTGLWAYETGHTRLVAGPGRTPGI